MTGRTVRTVTAAINLVLRPGTVTPVWRLAEQDAGYVLHTRFGRWSPDSPLELWVADAQWASG